MSADGHVKKRGSSKSTSATEDSKSSGSNTRLFYITFLLAIGDQLRATYMVK